MGQFPRSVYLDTNILHSLHFDVHKDPRLSELAERLRTLGGRLFIPGLVLEEALILRAADIKKSYDQLLSARANLTRYAFPQAISVAIPPYSELLQMARESYLRNLAEAGIEVFEIDYARFELAKLVEWAVQHKKPFGADDRGFKDALIVLSVITQSLSTPASNDIFVTENKMDFDHPDVVKIISDSGARIQLLHSLQDAQTALQGRIDSIRAEYYSRREEHLKEFLLQNSYVILDFVKSQDISPSFLTDGYPGSSSVRILDISLASIREPHASFPRNPEVPEPVPVSFTAHLKIKIQVNRSHYCESKVQIGHLMQRPSVVGLPSRLQMAEIEIDTEKDLLVFGQVTSSRVDDNVSFSALSLQSLSEKDFRTLLGELLLASDTNAENAGQE